MHVVHVGHGFRIFRAAAGLVSATSSEVSACPGHLAGSCLVGHCTAGEGQGRGEDEWRNGGRICLSPKAATVFPEHHQKKLIQLPVIQAS